ncbi:MAG: hypothetical protein ACPGGK_17100, partial [Pikeienuella sp.]
KKLRHENQQNNAYEKKADYPAQLNARGMFHFAGAFAAPNSSSIRRIQELGIWFVSQLVRQSRQSQINTRSECVFNY